jgi:hypothetical protein
VLMLLVQRQFVNGDDPGSGSRADAAAGYGRSEPVKP